jgi:hypothetical protein
MSQLSPTRRDYARALKAIAQTRREVERLLADVSRDETYVASLLGPILANLRESESQLRQLQNNA